MLARAVADGVRATITALRAEHPFETFYYYSLITTGEGSAPRFLAWSTEALEAVVAREGEADAISDYRWAYSESPYYRYGFDRFVHVRELWAVRGDLDPADEGEWDAEVEFRIGAMVDAMMLLDREGLFGTGTTRLGVVINVEWMPPDAANVSRARALNPPQALEPWLRDNAWLADDY
jgi:hypothetical protein